MLDEIIASNESLDPNNQTIAQLLISIETLIPIEYRENFYNNLRTLQIEFVDEDIQSNNLVNGVYKIFENKILIKIQNGNDNYSNINQQAVLLHELLHMASARIIDIDKKVN